MSARKETVLETTPLSRDPEPGDASPLPEAELQRELARLRRVRPRLGLGFPVALFVAASLHLTLVLGALSLPVPPRGIGLAGLERSLSSVPPRLILHRARETESLPRWLKPSGDAASAGVLGLLRAPSGSRLASAFGRDSAPGLAAEDALGGLIGDSRGGGGIGEAYGLGGLGGVGKAGRGRFAGRRSSGAAWRAGRGSLGVGAPRRVTSREASAPAELAGLLTAATVGDLDRYDHYLSFLRRHSTERDHLGLAMERRLRVRVLDVEGRPVNNAMLRVVSPAGAVRGRTHADGRWDLFPGVSLPQASGAALLSVEAEGRTVERWIAIPARGEGEEQTIRLPLRAAAPIGLELAFLVDVTGSMGDELGFLRREILSIVERVRAAVPGLQLRLGAVLYRDRGDHEPLRVLSFTRDPSSFRASLDGIGASGGGDFPEDMNAGLEAAIRRLQWSSGNTARVLVQIADAPPQTYQDQAFRYPQAMREASARGVRLLPVAASGADRTVEVLFRAMAAFTSTPYVYLTDDSGVGNAHLEADTERVAVERFNDLLVRLLVSDLRGKGMHEPGRLGPRDQSVARRGRSQGPS
jgi:hypothetical protein